MSFRHDKIAQSAGTASLESRLPSGVRFSQVSRAGAALEKEAKLMQLFTPSTAAVLLIAGGLLGIPAANAQVPSPAPSASDKSTNIPDQKLDAAAAAIERVASLKQ